MGDDINMEIIRGIREDVAYIRTRVDHAQEHGCSKGRENARDIEHLKSRNARISSFVAAVVSALISALIWIGTKVFGGHG